MAKAVFLFAYILTTSKNVIKYVEQTTYTVNTFRCIFAGTLAVKTLLKEMCTRSGSDAR